jgi:hypothetical protein
MRTFFSELKATEKFVLGNITDCPSGEETYGAIYMKLLNEEHGVNSVSTGTGRLYFFDVSIEVEKCH